MCRRAIVTSESCACLLCVRLLVPRDNDRAVEESHTGFRLVSKKSNTKSIARVTTSVCLPVVSNTHEHNQKGLDLIYRAPNINYLSVSPRLKVRVSLFCPESVCWYFDKKKKRSCFTAGWLMVVVV